jgi:hypothetical protein
MDWNWRTSFPRTGIVFALDGHTLVEEHIIGIPGDQFINHELKATETNLVRVAKEFIKFNERCFCAVVGRHALIQFVIDMTADFDDTQYRFSRH